MSSVGFALAVGPLGPPFVVAHAIRGDEGMSRLYRFDVEVSTFVPGPIFERFILGRGGLLAMRVAGSMRHIHGRVVSVTTLESHDDSQGLGRYTVRLAPNAWALKRRHDSRIFQDKSIDEILKAITEPLGIELRFDLERRLPKRPYTTQFEESDWAFFTRLCAENGLLFYFQQPETALGGALFAALDAPVPALAFAASAFELLRSAGARGSSGSETIVVTDRASYLPIAPASLGDILESAVEGALYGIVGSGGEEPAGPTLPFRSAGSLVGATESIHEFATRQRVSSTRATYREFDPERPLVPFEHDKSVIPARRAEDPIGELIAAAPSPARVRETFDEMLEDDKLELYFHEGRDLFIDADHSQREPERILAQARRKKLLARGKSNVARLSAGHSFKLEEYPLEILNSGWVVTRVTHRGSSSFADSTGVSAYDNSFECVPVEVPFVGKRPRRRVLQSCLTATVVGPGDEEIHVDARGRIKVKFHWDRSAEASEPTCWIRVMQAWGGTAWGAQFIPRVGMEAVVAFENGDPDKPLVLGCAYNRVLPLPFTLPEEKTRSGWRTHSTPDATGYNELSFEDRASHEQIFMHAQRDLDAEVGRNRTATIGEDDISTIGHDQRVRIEADQHIDVEGARRTRVHADDHVHVDGARAVDVRGDLHVHAHGRAVRVDQDDEVTAGRNIDLAARDVFLSTTRSIFASACEGVHLVADQNVAVHGGQRVSVSSDNEIFLSAGGGAFIRIVGDTIQISAPTIRLNATDAQGVMSEGEVKFKVTDTFQAVSDGKVVLKAESASLGLKSEAKLDGTKVLLNSPEQASDTIEVEELHTSTIVLRDQDGEAVPNALVLVRGEDGSEFMARTGEDGTVVAPVDGSATVTFPELSNTEDE